MSKWTGNSWFPEPRVSEQKWSFGNDLENVLNTCLADFKMLICIFLLNKKGKRRATKECVGFIKYLSRSQDE